MARRLFFFIGCLLVGNFVYAQIINDSTVQVVAYWKLGDKREYKCRIEEYSVEGKDTIWGNASEKFYTLEVVESTKDGYIIEYRCPEETDREQDKRELPYRLAMDVYGRFLDITNWNQISRLYESKERMLADIDYVVTPLFYHGHRLVLNKEYKERRNIAYPWISKDAVIPFDVTFGVYKMDDETSRASFYRNQQCDAMQLNLLFFKDLIQQLSPEELEKLTSRQIPYLEVETFLDLDIHLNTGWPEAALFKKVVYIDEKQQVRIWYFDSTSDESEK